MCWRPGYGEPHCSIVGNPPFFASGADTLPRLSVILPVKDGEAYLRQAVTSTLRALPRDAELVILDDGSTDRTPNILEEFSGRVVVHTNSAPQGLSRGLNRMLEATDSDFVARMDADDICLPWRFRRQLRLVRQADLTFTSIVFVDGRGLPRRPDLVGAIGPDTAALHLVLASCFSHPTMLARRSAIPLGGYRDLAAEDYDMWLRIAASGARIARDPLPGLLYRRHSTQVSSSDAWKQRRVEDLADERILDAYRNAVAALDLPGARSVPAPVLNFVMSLTPPADTESLEWLADLYASVGSRASAVKPTERLALSTRLGRMRSRLAHHDGADAMRAQT